jgi:NAD(P)-dependent dehydrogenase (short-subunit alcohol dehydrogenase family)
MFSMELAERLEGSGVRITSNALDPGTVNTKMLLSGWGPIGIPIQQANDVFQLATSENFADVTGQYFVSLRQCNPPAPAYDMAARHRLWDILQSQTGAEWK